MDKGFVYIGRMMDHNGIFIGNSYKIGKTTHYKIRETQLNSTHLPIDILFIRVFETDNMSALESIIHTCFEDYRIQKKYTDRKNIMTEWFDIEDGDVLNKRIDNIIRFFPNITEVNMISEISSDKTTTVEEKKEFVDAIKRIKTKLELKVNGEDQTQDYAADTFVLAFTKIADQIGWDKLLKDEELIALTQEEFLDKWTGTKASIREVNGYKVWTGISNIMKAKILNKHIQNNNLTNIEVHYETIS